MRPVSYCAALLLSAALAVPALANGTPAQSPGLEDQAVRPAWSQQDIASLRAVLEKAADEGLNPSDYRLPSPDDPHPGEMLTKAALAYLADVGQGRARLRNLDSDVAFPPAVPLNEAALSEALERHQLAALLGAAPPSHPEYVELKKALGFYRALDERGGWPMLAANAKPDELRQRLSYEDPPAGEPSADLALALKRFQQRHGLFPDGRLNARTLGELNVTADARVLQIEANMERWRWLPRTLESDVIMVNAANQSLRLIWNGKEVLRSRVVVGKPKTPTPMLRAEGAGVTINPPWNVPDSIARKEILPKLKKNPAYLQSEDMVLVNGPPGDPHGLHVPWRDIPAGTFPYRIQQHPGRKNALGTLKIELPNRFDVYLHDTPVKRAFALPVRDISHGCVRVERILPLASYALSADTKTMEDLLAAISAGDTRYLPFSRKLPVYFLYWTSFTDNGALQFRPDIYGRDRRLIERLQENFKISANLANCSRG